MPARRTPKGYRYFRREFLNREGWYLGAHILATVSEDDNYARVNIADCDRVIRLEFDGADRQSLRNAQHKLDVLISTFTAVRAELAEGYEGHRQHEAERRRRRSS